MDFDPNNVGVKNGNFFGFPNDIDTSNVVLLSVPWDVTTSYRPGTSSGPKAILEASPQLDFFDFDIPDAWEMRIASLPEFIHIRKLNTKLRPKAEKIIAQLEKGIPLTKKHIKYLETINSASKEVNRIIEEESINFLKKGKIVGIVGGDHSSPLGLLRALNQHLPSFGILHIDAHADLRVAYEGFEFSHASIMYNSIQLPAISHLVQVGIRDMSAAEIDFARNDERIKIVSDSEIKKQLFSGKTWQDISEQIINQLPENVYISFDIDGLSPEYCPNTGTPVPGGLSFDQVNYLLNALWHSSKQVVGFDLCEVAPGKNNDEWDANVGARILFKLCLLANKH